MLSDAASDSSQTTNVSGESNAIQLHDSNLSMLFFLTHYALNLGFVSTLEHHDSFMLQLGRLHVDVQHAQANGIGGPQLHFMEV